jgi:ubiquinone/menaquinone biosynthesis C-methylase UbiE
LRYAPHVALGRDIFGDGWVARAYDRGVQGAFRELLPVLTADLLPNLAGARKVLDVGCGPGQVTVYAAEQLPGTEVWGVDLAPTMIELARGHAGRSPAASRLHFEVADVARLPFPDGTFDRVMSSGSTSSRRADAPTSPR